MARVLTVLPGESDFMGYGVEASMGNGMSKALVMRFSRKGTRTIGVTEDSSVA